METRERIEKGLELVAVGGSCLGAVFNFTAASCSRGNKKENMKQAFFAAAAGAFAIVKLAVLIKNFETRGLN